MDVDAIGDCILLQSICVSQYLWENKIRGEFIEFIEQLTEVSDIRVESRFNQALAVCWPNILTGICLKLPRKAEYPHQKYSDIETYVKEYLLPRYCDTIKFSADQFPGACHCLAGIVVKFGLGYLIQDVNTLQNVVCFCLRQQDTHQQC